MTSITTALKNAVNADADLQNLGVTATSIGTAITIKSTSLNATTYAQSVSTNATETITLSVNQNTPRTVLVGGTLTVSDQLKINVYDAALSGTCQ